MTISIDGSNVRNGPHYNPDNFNYNLGIVSVEAYVEPYCPFSESTKQTFNIILNYQTIVQGGFSEEEKKNIRAVPGIDGIFLRENYRYLSNFAKLENGQEVDGSDGVINPVYKEWQTWNVVGHPMVKRPSDSGSCSANSPNWRLKKINFSNTIEGDRYISRVLDSESAGSNALDRIDASQDSNIYAPTQTAVTLPASSDADCKNGIHWRLEKSTPLFMGQDFFIEFHKDNLTEDVANFDIIESWQNDPGNRYQCLNSNVVLPGTVGDFKDVNPPANQAVKTYKPKINKSNNTVEAWEADDESNNYYDLNRQAYYIVELGSDLWDLTVPDASESIEKQAKYIIMIPQNWRPTIFKIAKPEGASRYIAYNLGVYNGLHGSDLINKRDKFRMTVRNHLGKLVITFDGKEDDPWIIQGSDIFVVPEGKMSVWGGNISSSVIFSPLLYNQKASMLLPPGVLGSCNGYQFGTNLGVDDLGYELNVGKVSRTGVYRRISPDQPGIEISEGFIYSCDAQAIREVAVTSGISSNFIDDDIGPNYLGLFGGVSTQLRALRFSARASGAYNVSSGPVPTTPINEQGQIKNIDDGILKSAIGLEVDGSSEDEILEWATPANMVAGGHYFQKSGQSEPWKLKNCKTPIISGITFSLRDVVDPLWGTLNTRNRIDHRIMNFTDTWSASDYHKIDHSGGITLYLNEYDRDAAKIGQRVTNEEGDSIIEAPASSFMALDNVKKLQRRQFYVSIDVVYDNCSRLSTYENSKPFQKIRRERIFTGIAKNGIVKQTHGVATMDLELVDYFDVLEGKAFFNSPFFDGVRDINAVYEILRIGGFSTLRGSQNNGQSPGPAFLLQQAASRDGSFQTSFDGSSVVMEPYALPQSYNRLSEPFFKPEDGANLYDILFEFAKRSNKMMYFDRYGVFHYENRPFDDHIFAQGVANVAIEPSWSWTALPASNRANSIHNYGNTPNSVRNGLLIENEATIKYDISSCYNEFKVVTATPDREIIVGSDIDYNKFKGSFNQRQNEQGWLGYRRPLYQAEGLFGSEFAVEQMINNYSKVKNPPIEVSFEAKGLPVKALDVGVLHMFNYRRNQDSETRQIPFIITNVSSTIDPRKNSWDQSIQGEWIQTENAEV